MTLDLKRDISYFFKSIIIIIKNQLMINAILQQEAPIREAVFKVVPHYAIIF